MSRSVLVVVLMIACIVSMYPLIFRECKQSRLSCVLGVFTKYKPEVAELSRPTEEAKFLMPTLVPNVFHYVWCGNRTFSFQHYLSILSTIRHMRPDTIYFHYDKLPFINGETLYDEWFSELTSDYPFIIRKPLKNPSVCKDISDILNVIMHILEQTGGIFITEGIILTRELDLNKELLVRWDNETKQGFIQVTPQNSKMIGNLLSQPYPKCHNVTMITEWRYYRKQRMDTPFTTLEQISHDTCMTIDGEYYPRDFWERPDILGSSVRFIVYGTSEIRMPKRNPGIVVPNIAHMIWVGGGEMDFLFYLGVLSIVYIQKVDKLYIHGDMPPSGERWNRVENIPQVVFKYRNFEGMQIYGNSVGGMFHFWQASHWSDIIRCDIMLKWGGIYIDTDAFFVKKFDEEVMHYDTVSHYSFMYRKPYPDTFVSGLLLAKPGAEFFARFQKSMRYYLDSNWMYNALLAPYKIMERYPHLVHIDPRIQVVCLVKKCHPTWLPQFKNLNKNHLNSGSLPDWKNDANVYHFCANGCPDELQNETTLREANMDNMYTQMGRHILSQAGLLNLLD